MPMPPDTQRLKDLAAHLGAYHRELLTAGFTREECIHLTVNYQELYLTGSVKEAASA